LKNLPKEVRVGYRTFKIEPWASIDAAVNDRLGECDVILGVIRVHEGLPPSVAAEVLLHEIFHAVWRIGACDGGDEEKVVTVFGHIMTQILQDNPDVIALAAGAASRTE
jgi:hypothetical protein